jgi:hypothetical protein
VDFIKVLREEGARSDVLLAVIGPHWIDARYENGNRRLDDPADYVRVEIATALQREITVVPILLDGASMPKSEHLPANLQGLVRRNGLGVRHASFQSDVDKLIARLERLAEEEAGPDEADQKQRPVSNIPIRVPIHFMGRDDSVAAIDKALGRNAGRAAITALHGLRGIGKTTLAAAYADHHRGDYRATWWIRAQTEATMRADLVGLGVRLNWVAADQKEGPALATVMERLRHDGEGLLLIYDDAPDAAALRKYLPLGDAARVLVTSNTPALRGIAEPIEIEVWPKEIGAQYLMARTGRRGEHADAEALSDALGGLPLAHEQAGAYCERLGISLADYRKRFNDTPAQMLDTDRDAAAEYHGGLTVAKTFALAISEAGKLHSAAEPLIVHAAVLAPGPIPVFLFREGREQPIAARDRLGSGGGLSARRL